MSTLKVNTPTENPTIDLAIDTLKKEKQAIVFVNSKASAEKTAEDISKKTSLNNEELARLSTQILKALSRPTKQCERLANCVKRGIAYHHAGLVSKQRELIEDSFREGKIKIICATPTLAYGLDLPAYRVIIRDLRRFGPRGLAWIPVLEYLQQCLPYNTRIITEKGQVSIGKIVEEGLSLKVLSFNTKNKKFEFKPITKYFQKNSRKLIELKTNEGYKLKLTEEHPLFIDDSWIKAKDVREGDKVLFSTYQVIHEKIPSFFDFIKNKNLYVPKMGYLIKKTKQKFNFSDKQLAKKISVNYKSIYHYKNNIKNMPLHSILVLLKILKVKNKKDSINKVKTRYGSFLKIPKKIDENLLWLVGVIATDGNIDQTFDKRTGSEYIKIRVFNTNKKIINKSVKELKRLICGKVYISLKNERNYTIEIGSTLLARILKEHFGIPFKNKTSTVRVPKFLFYASRRLIGAYLAGVFDGDGCYTVTKNKRFNTTKNHRILFVTASKKFSKDIQQLLLRLGIISKLIIKTDVKPLRIKGKLAKFKKPNYYVYFNRKKYVNLFSKYCHTQKCKIKTEYKTYNNLHKHYESYNQSVNLKIIGKRAINLNEKISVYNLGIKDNENYFADNFLVHNCGRAGRPKFDKQGEAIAVAKTEPEKDKINNKYISGFPENIYSKLAVEPVLRTYVLSLIVSGFVNTKQQLLDLFEKTFWAYQYQDPERMDYLITKTIELLEDYEFITFDEDKDKLKATNVGVRVSQLYLDPYTAHRLIKGLQRAASEKPKVFAYIHLVCQSLEIRPFLRVRSAEYDEVQEQLLTEDLVVLEPSMYDPEHDDYLDASKTALMLRDWIEENDEEFLLEKYKIRPGEHRVKLNVADWLLYSTVELARVLFFKDIIADLMKTRVRLKYGVKEELLPLLKLKNVGRVRARKLYNNRLRTTTDLKKASIETLMQILGGRRVAESLKEQLGQGKQKVLVKENKRKGQINIKDF